MKKIMSIFISFCMVLSNVVGLTVYNAYAETDGIFTYRIENENAVLTDCDSSASGSVEIPNYIGGYPVTSIGMYAFSGCSNLTSIIIPDSVTYIGGGAFENCSNLTSITIPDSVTYIGGGAFENCSNLTSIIIPESVTKIGNGAFRNCSSLASATIPESITSIGAYAFYWCVSLASVNIPDSVTYIGAYAFSNCHSLESVAIPNDVTKIKENTFSGCRNLTNITIPDNVKYIGKNAFSNCSGLASITIPDSVTQIEQNVFYGCTGLTSITIPDSVTGIKEGAFSYCSNLTSIAIPGSVTRIEQNAFSGCSSLTSITIPNSVTQIEQNVFYGCTGLTSITIPDSVTGIKEGAFSYCSNLTSIAIPGSVKRIEQNAFSGCSSLTSITIPNSVTSIGYRAFSGCKLSDIFYSGRSDEWNNIALGDNAIPDNVTIHYAVIGITGISLDKTVISIAPGETEQLTAAIEPQNATNKNIIWTSWDENIATVKDGKVTGVTYGKTLITAATEDGGYLAKCEVTVSTSPLKFSFESGVITGYSGTDTDIYIPAAINGIKVTKIGDNAFKDQKGITKVTIPDGITDIGYYAFSNCSSLSSITIPSSVKTICSGFYNCIGLKEVHISDIAAWCGGACNSELLKYADLYLNDKLVTDLVIPDSVVNIANSAFENCSSITSVTIPSSVVHIGTSAFYNCKNIKEVHISDISSWCNITFGSNPLQYASSLYVNGELTENLVIPDGVASVGTAFAGFKGLKSVVLSKSISKINDNAFWNCSNIESVTIPNSVTHIGASAFKDCSRLCSADLPDSIVSVGKEAFYQCRLKNINIGRYVSFIGKDAFTRCGVEKITLSKNSSNYILLNNVLYTYDKTSIVLCASGSVTSVTVPSEVKNIDEGTFRDCKKLESVDLSFGIEKIGNSAFSGCSKLTSVTIPKSVTRIEHDAFSYCDNLKEVHISDIASWCKITFIDNPLNNKEANLYLNDKLITDLVIPNGITEIDDTFSGGSSFTSVTMPDSLTRIGHHAFMNCSGLTEIAIPDSVTDIDVSAFNGCSGLTEVVIPNSVININNAAFSNCSSLRSVTLPKLLTKISESMFNGCSELTDVIIPNGVTKIGALAFNNCSALANINIPASVNSIYTVYGTMAISAPFLNCSNLTDISVDENNEHYCSENGVLFNKDKTEVIKYPEGKEDSYYEIPHGVESIYFRAFDNCKSLTNIKLPATLNRIMGSDRYNSGVVFSKCKNLSEIYVDENNNQYFSNDGVLFDKNKTLVRYPEGSEKNVYSIPDGIVNVGNLAFYNCDNLKEVKIPYSVTSVEEDAFNTAAVENVYYEGTKADRKNISIAENGNSSLLAAAWHYQGEDGQESKPVIKAAEVFGEPGTTVKMNIMLENNPGVALLGFNIGYDKNAMTLISVTNGEIFDDADILNGNIQKNPYMFTCMNSTENKNGDGVLISLTFKIADNCPAGDYAINISECEAYSIDEFVIDFKTIDSKVIISNGTETGTDISVSIPNYEKGGTVMAGLYDKSGKLLNVKSYTPAESVDVSFEQNGAYIKVMHWNMDNMAPLSPVQLIIPVNVPNYQKGGTVMAGLYDKSGKLLNVKSYTPTENVDVSFEQSGAYVKVMQWDMNMMMPLMEYQVIYIN